MDQPVLILIARDFPEKHRKPMMEALKKANASFLVVDETSTEVPSVLIGQTISVLAVVTEGLFKSKTLTDFAKEAINNCRLASVAIDEEVEMPDWFVQGGTYFLISTFPSREDIRTSFEFVKSLSAQVMIPNQSNELLN